ncbi:hypothetical protein HC031_06920 [Planosporangium thailandense]|uniref:PLL-like beta propeller domain-containing protein n=1 Tax=Planosporangium thailandense TaxID=765197 RepID=A0ABX0XTW9_9ACTN|nr:hypothetical protein [Planosporangium thailandense]NJC69452.1 hypothetical protein [Planosporangium thailandense]
MQIFAHSYDHRIVTKYQTSPNGVWTSGWTNLGNPNDQVGNPEQAGTPIVTTNADGRIQIFIKNGGGGMSSAWQTSPNGTFTPWHDFGGTGIQDPVAAIVNKGRIEIFASSVPDPRNNANQGTILHWFQHSPNDVLVYDNTFPTDTPASPPAVAANADGRLEVHYRKTDSSVGVIVQDVPDGGWRKTPTNIGGQGGVGEPTLFTAGVETRLNDVRIFAFTRNGGGGVSMTRQTGSNQPYGGWQDLGGAIVDYPAVEQESSGLLDLFAVGLDGKLYINKQVSASTTASFGGWKLVG